MKGVLNSKSDNATDNLPIPKLLLPSTVEGSQWALKYNLQDLTDEEFSTLLASGEPFVLVGVTMVKVCLTTPTIPILVPSATMTGRNGWNRKSHCLRSILTDGMLLNNGPSKSKYVCH